MHQPWRAFEREQREVCARFGAPYEPIDPETKVGVDRRLLDGEQPFNGLRHAPEKDTNGWYLWGSDRFPADDGFVPSHAGHLVDDRPEVVPYLALPPGWRFLIAPAWVDVWEDSMLLNL